MDTAEEPQVPRNKLRPVKKGLRKVKHGVKTRMDCLALFLLDALAFSPACDVYGTSL
jgi:hypothetical protein